MTDNIKLPPLLEWDTIDSGTWPIRHLVTTERAEAYGLECARAAVEADRQQRGEATAADGMAILRAALSADPDYAWSWHCAVWAAAHDEGLETGAANRAAARLMRAAFDVDTTDSPNFNPAHLATEKEQQ